MRCWKKNYNPKRTISLWLKEKVILNWKKRKRSLKKKQENLDCWKKNYKRKTKRLVKKCWIKVKMEKKHWKDYKLWKGVRKKKKKLKKNKVKGGEKSCKEKNKKATIKRNRVDVGNQKIENEWRYSRKKIVKKWFNKQTMKIHSRKD